jgi:hypothetical protein
VPAWVPDLLVKNLSFRINSIKVPAAIFRKSALESGLTSICSDFDNIDFKNPSNIKFMP